MNKEILEWLEKEINNKETQISGYRIYKSNNQSDIAKMLIIDLQKDIKILETIKQTYENNELKQEAVLTDEEKEYLKAFLKPFRKTVKYIKMIEHLYDNTQVCLEILCGGALVYLPPFEPNTMYKGMKMDREYTLEELGITYKEDVKIKVDGRNILTVDCSTTRKI